MPQTCRHREGEKLDLKTINRMLNVVLGDLMMQHGSNPAARSTVIL